MPDKLKPGQPAPESGQYKVVGPRGGDKGREVTSTKDKPLPPTQNPGERYILADKTKHKGDK
ncbi:hypothetical protein P9G84_22110 [Brevibacillus centrosporus]|uniref:hypothetical protein n=1 Tax=Brevibacillus centrosporus TaxID=54910 RepID=UPI000F09DE53|nr:hypothetical protein [Brevibacillus centrosporus]MEC2131622.1 hypothetical protein [Brevibacillus centrosporus]RNB72110.1 hypothetical protein EDM55_06870 [Brevibacillus centrosporus]GED35085.1 hypothetical protein BCE02nite_62260 [Brevibacillus centrosporus]